MSLSRRRAVHRCPAVIAPIVDAMAIDQERVESCGAAALPHGDWEIFRRRWTRCRSLRRHRRRRDRSEGDPAAPMSRAGASSDAAAAAIAQADRQRGEVISCRLLRPRQMVRPGAFAAGIVEARNFDGGLLLYVARVGRPDRRQLHAARADRTHGYQEPSTSGTGMQVVFGLIYFGVALMVLAAAIWMGIGSPTGSFRRSAG